MMAKKPTIAEQRAALEADHQAFMKRLRSITRGSILWSR